MSSENLGPVEELQRLDQQIDQVKELAELKPIYFRLEEIARQHAGDFEIQITVGEIKQRVVQRGSQLKQKPPAAASPPAAPPPPAPSPPAGATASTASSIAAESNAPPPPSPPPSPPASQLKEPAGLATASLPAAASPTPPAPSSAAPPCTGPAVAKPAARNVRPGEMKRAVVIGGLIGLAAAVGIIAVLLGNARGRNRPAAVDVAIRTMPPGASVRLNGQELCVSDCTAQLEVGTHQLTAVLEGYEPSVSEVTIAAGQPASVSLSLLPQPQTVRILADLAQGTVTFDGRPAGALQDGQFVFDNVAPGAHTVRVAAGNSEATFSFELAVASLPVVTGNVATRNLLAILVSTFARQGRVVSSAGPFKLALNGRPQGEVGPAGLLLADYQPGAAEMRIGEGAQQRTLNESFGPGPMLTAFLKTDRDIGTLIVATNQDDVRVFVNGAEQPRRTERGQLRIQTIGHQVVRVAKEGFEDPPPQTATVVKGSEVRLTFNLKALPEFSSLVISGGTPSAEVLIDGSIVGMIGPDGAFRNSSINPGDRVIELRRPQHESKRFERTFRRGQTVTINGADAVLVALREPPPPPKPEPPPPPKTEPPAVKAAPAPKPVVGTMANFDAPGMWREQDGIWRHRGEARLTYGVTPVNGIFTFAIHLVRGGNRLLFRGGRVRWFLDYQDARNYALFELDQENFWAKDVVNGRTTERVRVPHPLDRSLRSWIIQIDVSPTRAIHRIQRGNDWVTLDTWTDADRNFSDGKFGILVNGDDEVGLSDFLFTGR